MMSNARGGEWILVVDDDLDIRDAIQQAFEDDNLVVETAVDGWQALGWMLHDQPSLVVLDLMLPKLDGLEVASALRMAYAQEVPFVVISDHPQGAELSKELGAFAYLSKPFSLPELLSTVRTALNIRQSAPCTASTGDRNVETRESKRESVIK